MDTRSLVQTVAVLVVLSILVRWIPLDPEQAVTDWLGRGLPAAHLAEDAVLLELARSGSRGIEGEHAVRAWLRPAQLPGVTRGQARAVRGFWLARADELRERAAREPGLFAQARGLVRNDHWLLTYDLYPVPVRGAWIEAGGRPDDPVLPGAVVFDYRTR